MGVLDSNNHFQKKKIYKISFELKLLAKVIRLNHEDDNMSNVIVLNTSFIIFVNFNYHGPEQRYYHVLKFCITLIPS